MRELAEKTLWLIPVLPLVGFLINGLAGGRLPKRVVGAIGCLLPVGSLVLSALAVLQLREGAPLAQTLVTWISTGDLAVSFSLRVDALAAVMILVVTGVGTLIHIYSIGYMGKDEGFARFFAYLNLFMFAMLVLVLADNLLLMFVGWEGVGLCSYLLIGFWHHDVKNADAGKKAFIVNRIGDLGFILGMLGLFGIGGTLQIEGMREAVAQASPAMLAVPALLLFVGACGKSAQIPLYVWLPDAMAGPTPVSALIHAATMVTAGIYMIGRLHFLYARVPGVMEVIVLVASATALLAAVIAVAQNDIKKILAYSTISQLGYMFAGMATAHFTSGLFHLVTHAFFKALLFLGAGAIIHALHEVQDIRRMGGLARSKPGVFIVFICGAVALMGCPGSAGWYSKDAVLAAVGAHSGNAFFLAHVLLLLTASLTAFYTMRMVVVVFFGAPSEEAKHPHRTETVMMAPLVVLALLSVAGGILLAGPLEHLFENVWPVTARAHLGLEQAHHAAAVESVIAFGLGAGLAFLLYSGQRRFVNAFVESEGGRWIHRLVVNKFYVDEIYHWTVVAAVRMGAAALWFVVDRLLIDAGMVHGSARVCYAVGAATGRAHRGTIAMGMVAIIVGVLGMLSWLTYRLIS